MAVDVISDTFTAVGFYAFILILHQTYFLNLNILNMLLGSFIVFFVKEKKLPYEFEPGGYLTEPIDILKVWLYL